ncbi:phosphatase PAP2 family protein [Pedococcus sp. NPDC057267]|uniref:phosphatase PAP2 family protein n=1 Tax=Pedococcus sp. NPDC057267 TaxID=3346077 RepID=UPI0036381F96
MRLTEYDDIGEFAALAFVVIFGMVVWATVAEQRLAAFTRDPAGARAQTLARRAAARTTVRTLLVTLRPTRRLITIPWVACAAALAILTVGVLTGVTRQFDAVTLPWFTALDTPGVGHLTARVLVMGGQFWLVGTAATGVAVWRGIQQRNVRPVVVTGAAMVVMSVSIWLLKVLVGRTAPRGGANTVLAGGHSYPSGHAATAVVCLALAAALIARTPHTRRWLLPLASAAAGVVGVCTIVLGYHWVTDVAAGWAAGSILAIPAIRWLGRYPATRPRTSPTPPSGESRKARGIA